VAKRRKHFAFLEVALPLRELNMFPIASKHVRCVVRLRNAVCLALAAIGFASLGIKARLTQ